MTSCLTWGHFVMSRPSTGVFGLGPLLARPTHSQTGRIDPFQSFLPHLMNDCCAPANKPPSVPSYNP